MLKLDLYGFIAPVLEYEISCLIWLEQNILVLRSKEELFILQRSRGCAVFSDGVVDSRAGCDGEGDVRVAVNANQEVAFRGGGRPIGLCMVLREPWLISFDCDLAPSF